MDNHNGQTNGNGAKPDYPEPDDLDSGRLHDLAVDLLRELNPDADPLAAESVFGSLLRASYYGYAYGYLRAVRDFRRSAIPVKLEKDTEFVVTLEGAEAAAVLKSFGLWSDHGGNGHNQG